MRPGGASAPLKGVLVVGAFAILWFNLLAVLFPNGHPPSEFSLAVVPGLVVGALFALGPILLFMFAFVGRSEGRSLKSAITSVGLNLNGVKQSLIWSVPFFVAVIISISLLSILGATLFGPNTYTYPYQSTLPTWYAFFTLIYSIFSSLTEEVVGVGYIVDRLMPSHPQGLAASTPAVLARSAVALLYHAGTYLILYRLSPASALLTFMSAFLSFTLIGFAYVKSKSRNVSGPWAMHYVFDVLGVLLTYHL
jgi:hypothetical protein